MNISENLPLVSVIIPVYNVEDYLSECIESVLNQSYQNLEVIVINDGSTDNSGDIIDKYRDSDERIVAIIQANKGLAETRNVGIKHATGEYIYFLDSDDKIALNMFEVLIPQMQSKNLEMMHFNAEAFSDERLSFDKTQYIRKKTEQELNSLKAFLETKQYSCSVCLYITKRKLLLSNQQRFLTGILHEDEDYTFRLMASTNKQMFTEDVMFYRRYREGSIMTSSRSLRNIQGYYKVFTSLANFYETKKINDKRLKSHVTMFFLHSLRLAIQLNQLHFIRRNTISDFKIVCKFVKKKHIICALMPRVLASKLSK